MQRISATTRPTNCAAGTVSVQTSRWLGDCYGRPSASLLPVPYAIQQLMAAPWRTRTRCMSVTSYLTASALNNQGTVYAAQVPTRHVGQSWTGAPYAMLGASTSPVAAGSRRFEVPLDENTMQLMDPKCYVAPATDGAYCVSRYLGDAYMFSEPFLTDGRTGYTFLTSDAVFDSVNTTPQLRQAQLPVTPVFTSIYDPAAYTGFYKQSWIVGAALNPAAAPTVVAPPLDSVFTDMTTSITIYRGLSNAATVTVRCVGGFEVVVLPDSPSRIYVNNPAPYNAAALQMYHEYADAMRSAYPSSYNSLGTMFKWLLGAARSVAPTILRSLPVVGDVYRALTGPSPLATQQEVVTTTVPRRSLSRELRVLPRRSLSRGSTRSRSSQRVRVKLPAGKARRRRIRS
jgi:hypothetical protein